MDLRTEYDYDYIWYPIPFSQLFKNKSSRYKSFGQSDSSFPSFIHFGEVCKDVYANSPLLFVTGSSSNHVFANINCMYSIVAADANASIVFINFGLSGHELRVLKKHFSLIHSLHISLNSSAQLYYRVFNFNNFPNWISINNYYVGGYAWKVISYMDVLHEVHGPLLWTDAGSVLNGTMIQEMSYMHDYGVYSPYSSGDVATLVHNTSILFLQTHHMINSVDPFALMCTGGYLFIDGSNATIMKRVFEPLFECAFTKKCISPDLTNRNNHRQDQAILTMLLHSVGVEKSCTKEYTFLPELRRDCVYRNNCNDIFKQIWKRLRVKYDISCGCLFFVTSSMTKTRVFCCAVFLNRLLL